MSPGGGTGPSPATVDRAATLAARCGGAVVEEYGGVTVDVPPEQWSAALAIARDELGLDFFDWLSAVDELADGFSVVCHLAATAPASADGLAHVVLRTRLPLDAPTLPSATAVFPGAAWHERETWEMFGITFNGHPNLVPLLLPDGFVGRPLRKDYALQARLDRPWPGAR